MEIEVGNIFKVVNPNNPIDVIYTVTSVNGNSVSWDCVGKKHWYKKVTKGMILEHLNDLKDLIKIG